VSTLSVVDEILLKAPGWQRDGSKSVLSMMNRAQNYLFSKPTLQSVYIDPATGDYPFLTTVAGQFAYTIPDVLITIGGVADVPHRIKQVYELLSKNSNLIINDYGYQINDYNLIKNMRHVDKTIGDEVYFNFTPVAAKELDDAKIILPFDPGDTSDQYQYRAIIEPVQLTADTIALSIEQDDEMALIEGALGYIEFFDYGRSDRMDRFEQVYAPRLWGKYRIAPTPRRARGTLSRKF
jgi:hypothetical protein